MDNTIDNEPLLPQDVFTERQLIDWARQRNPLDIFTLPELKAAIQEAKEYAL